MIRILHISRAHSRLAERKIDHMARFGDLSFRLIRPNRWENEFGSFTVAAPFAAGAPTRLVRVFNRPDDPHRMVYGTLTFGLRQRPDLIHAQEEPDSLAALQIVLARALLAPRVPLILTTWQNVARPLGPHVRWIMRRSLGAASAMMCTTAEARDLLRAQGFRGAAPTILPAGFDPAVFHPRPGVPRDGAFTVSFAGRLVPEKGVDTLIDAIRRVGPPARLIIIGEGRCRSRLEEQARSSGVADRVEFTGPLGAEAVAARLASSDVFVLPSRTTPVWKEQFGRALAEAMGCGVAVVGSDSGAIPGVIGDAGLTFPEGDHSALAARLVELRDAPSLRASLAARGHARATRLFTPERLAEETAAFYRTVVSADRAARTGKPRDWESPDDHRP